MSRIIRSLTNKKLIWKTRPFQQAKLYRSVESIGFQCRPLFPQVRFYTSNQCPPKQPKKSSHGVAYTLGALALVGGATLGYAKYDPDFRQTLKEFAPFTDKLIVVLFQEESTLDAITQYYRDLTSSVYGWFGVEDKPKSHGKIRELPSSPAIKDYQAGDPKPKPSTSDVCDESVQVLEDKICASATEAVNAYTKAINALRVYNREIEYIIDEAVNKVKPNSWEIVRNKTKCKNDLIKEAQERAEQATKDVNKLKDVISRPTFTASDQTKTLIRNNITKVQSDIEQAKKTLNNEIKVGSVTEKYWDKVEKARKHFSQELEILFPNIDLSQKKMNINEEELDLFVLHTYANVLFYQKELARLESVMQEKLLSAVEAARRGGGEVLTNAQICEALEQEKRRLNLNFQQECLKLRKESEIDLREQLKLQSQTFTDHLNDAIKTRELEIERCLSRKFDEQLDTERTRFKMQIATMVGRLRGLDQAVKAKADADEMSKKSQVLWSACQSLLRAVRAGCPGLSWKDQIRPLEPELNAVKSAAGANDELVCVVLKGIPQEAKERGVYPEDALRERFLKVERVARTVALVPEEGAALPIHILSYIQSVLLVKAASPIPQAELNDEKVDFTKLTTNDVLQRAKYWLDRGDFAQALRYMNLLRGAPRCVARQWMNETRILLETQQAANTLMAHAASTGLVYL